MHTITKAILLALFLCAPAYTAPVALVLSGGGAKGAYEVGVWKAMTEKGIAGDVRVVSGTSVGGLNAALIASVASPSVIESFWTNHIGEIIASVNLSKARMEVAGILDDVDSVLKKRDEFRRRRFAEEAASFGIPANLLPPGVTNRIDKETERAFIRYSLFGVGKFTLRKVNEVLNDEMAEGWIDPSSLKGVLEDCIPRKWSDGAPATYATVLEKGTWKRKVFKLNDEPFDRMISIVRATSAIPVVFNNVEIDGKTYVDGGWTGKGGENVPITPVIENHPDISTIYVVYLNDLKTINSDGDRINVSDYPEKKIIEIIPSRSLRGYFGTLDFSENTCRELMQLGYDDAIRVIDENRQDAYRQALLRDDVRREASAKRHPVGGRCAKRASKAK